MSQIDVIQHRDISTKQHHPVNGCFFARDLRFFPGDGLRRRGVRAGCRKRRNHDW